MIFTNEITARYCETDQMGIIHHTSYINWLESGRMNFFREIGIPFNEIEKEGIYLAVRSINIKYLIPTYFDDDLVLETSIKSVKKAQLSFSYRIVNSMDCITTIAESSHA